MRTSRQRRARRRWAPWLLRRSQIRAARPSEQCCLRQSRGFYGLVRANGPPHSPPTPQDTDGDEGDRLRAFRALASVAAARPSDRELADSVAPRLIKLWASLRGTDADEQAGGCSGGGGAAAAALDAASPAALLAMLRAAECRGAQRALLLAAGAPGRLAFCDCVEGGRLDRHGSRPGAAHSWLCMACMWRPFPFHGAQQPECNLQRVLMPALPAFKARAAKPVQTPAPRRPLALQPWTRCAPTAAAGPTCAPPPRRCSPCFARAATTRRHGPSPPRSAHSHGSARAGQTP